MLYFKMNKYWISVYYQNDEKKHFTKMFIYILLVYIHICVYVCVYNIEQRPIKATVCSNLNKRPLKMINGIIWNLHLILFMFIYLFKKYASISNIFSSWRHIQRHWRQVAYLHFYTIETIDVHYYEIYYL